MAAGAVSGAVSSALGSGSNEAEELASKVNNFVCEILPKLSKMAVTKRETKLCEAFCLLWHHRRLGTMEGRQTNNKLISCAYVGVILDLWATGKIEITVQEKSTSNTRYTNALIKVVDATRTGSVLDAAGFNAILQLHEEGKTRKLKEWIENCVKCHPDDNCASVILDSFVEKGIIGKEEKWFGLKKIYPTKDKVNNYWMTLSKISLFVSGEQINYLATLKQGQGTEPQLQLVLEIRGITLRDVAPDGFISVLLPLLSFADNLHSVEDPLLGRHFNEAEYEKAKPRLDEILRNSGYLGLQN